MAVVMGGAVKRLALVLLAVACAAGCSRSPSAAPRVANIQSDAPLIAAFNASASYPRVLLIISPT